MHEYCHRCGGELAASEGVAPFCQHCGAPQLSLPDYSINPSDEEDGGESTGVLPPPNPKQVEWKTAILCAGAVAVIAAVLTLLAAQFPKLTFLCWLWTISGAAIALGFYQKRRPQAWIDAMVGVRIGMVAGFALIASIAAAMALSGLIARFGLHAMGSFDVELRSQIEKAAAMNPQPVEAMRYVRLPEFRAGIMLGGFAMMSGFVMIFSTIGGAMSGMLRMRRS
ncbi:MAG: hypothetical protein PW789_07355 [Edaphobacter sp.]|uniref:hypothetical protein n=1 Tax=Edaphobacter sp. TaxID=1934404 RepID=UPI00238224BE|nr:hypothetical protein [Edaphobacter sp.]MDE1176411.1 hypothetical protein [Edaphobacter sp.]